MNPLIILQGIPLWGKSFFIPLIMTYPECGLNLLDPEGGEPLFFVDFKKKLNFLKLNQLTGTKTIQGGSLTCMLFFFLFFLTGEGKNFIKGLEQKKTLCIFSFFFFLYFLFSF